MAMSSRRLLNRRIFANRMSTWLRRSDGYISPVVSRLMVVFPVASAVPGRRPSSCWTTVFGTCTLAFNDEPFEADAPPTAPMFAGLRDRNCALTSTSTFGTVYDAFPVNEVMNGSVTWQLRGSGLSIFVDASHVSRTPRPVLVPPWNTMPLRSRVFTLTLTPCQYWVRASPKSVSNVRYVRAPRSAASRVIENTSIG